MLKRLTGNKTHVRRKLMDRIANIRYCDDLCAMVCTTNGQITDMYSLEMVERYTGF
jgi:hypothetical protein